MIKNDDSITVALSEEEKTFIQEHIRDDVNQLILKYNTAKELEIKKLAAQILARQKGLKKLPEWSKNFDLVFPPPLSIEQASSEATARFKASIVSGHTLVDITGGTGIDHYYFSKRFTQTIYFEHNNEVSETAQLNFTQLGATNITVRHTDSTAYLQAHKVQADWLYADPARRDVKNEKVVLLSDCTPDIIHNLKLLYTTAENLMFKTSPLLDISKAVEELAGITEVYILGAGNECKELVFILNKNNNHPDYKRKVRILDPDGEVIHRIDSSGSEESQAKVNFADPKNFLYEPHAAVLKAGFFNLLCPIFGLDKIAPSSHLYTSERAAMNFPGRIFEVIAICKPDRNEVFKSIGTDKANLTIRNFPGTVQDLRKKLRLKEGGEIYLFATTLANNKKVVIATKKHL